MTSSQPSERRRHLRYDPGGGTLTQKCIETVAHIDPEPEGTFDPVLIGFIMQQSHSGICLVVKRHEQVTDKFERDYRCLIKAGPLHPLLAVIRWRRDLDDELFKAGFQFLE